MLPDLQPSSRLQGGGVEFQAVHLFVLVREFGEVWTSTETAGRLEAGRKRRCLRNLKSNQNPTANRTCIRASFEHGLAVAGP